MVTADLVLKNGKIHMVNQEDSIVEAVACKKGRIIFAGDMNEIETYVGSQTKTIDLKGKTVLPGFIDSHLHVPGNAFNILYNINLFDAKTEEETLSTIKSFVEAHPERDIYYGRGFMPAVFGGIESGKGPRKERLDQICPDKPIVLVDYGGHVVWLNSKALADFNITKDTPEVPGGIIEKDPRTGELWGVLKEEAKCLYPQQQFSIDEKMNAVKWMQDMLHSYGITGLLALRQSASSDPNPIFDAMAALEKTNELGLRICGAREIKVGLPEDPQIEELEDQHRKFRGNQIQARTAKFFVDGTIEGASAFLSQPYERDAGKGDGYYGEFLWEQERLYRTFFKTMQKGFNIHVHAIGDEAITRTIDALEKAQKKVPGEHRNVITHLQVVKPEDITRMAELNITACTNVFWHFKDPCVYFGAELPFLGSQRAEREFPLASFRNNGVRITCASDHPITPYPNPFFAIEVGVTRNLYNADYFKEDDINHMDDPKWLLGKEERVTVMDMVKAYTINGAYSLYREHELGSIEVGKFADMIVIDRDIFTIDPIEIEFTQVSMTIYDGNIVYEKQ